MRRQRRTADDFVRDMKAKQQRGTLSSNIERKTSEVTSERADACRESRWPVPTTPGSNTRSRVS